MQCMGEMEPRSDISKEEPDFKESSQNQINESLSEKAGIIDNESNQELNDIIDGLSECRSFDRLDELCLKMGKFKASQVDQERLIDALLVAVDQTCHQDHALITGLSSRVAVDRIKQSLAQIGLDARDLWSRFQAVHPDEEVPLWAHLTAVATSDHWTGYLEQKELESKAVRRVRGEEHISDRRARFVQGGSPGTGKKA